MIYRLKIHFINQDNSVRYMPSPKSAVMVTFEMLSGSSRLQKLKFQMINNKLK
jgi:hypothetical protein